MLNDKERNQNLVKFFRHISREMTNSTTTRIKMMYINELHNLKFEDMKWGFYPYTTSCRYHTCVQKLNSLYALGELDPDKYTVKPKEIWASIEMEDYSELDFLGTLDYGGMLTTYKNSELVKKYGKHLIDQVNSKTRIFLALMIVSESDLFRSYYKKFLKEKSE